MRWEDERYVRIYTRDTPDWIAMKWQGRAVFYELCRKVDRSGFIAVGKSGMRGLAGCLLMPQDVTEEGIDELLTDGCVKRVDGGLLIGNFIEAQETPQSDRARKRAQRERDRDSKKATSSGAGHAPAADQVDTGHSVTNRDAESQNVTESHARSQTVTNGHTASLCAVPYRTEPTNTHRAGAHAREERTIGPSLTADDLAAILAEIPILADLAADPGAVHDCYTGFVMTAGDTASPELAKAALGVLIARERLADMSPEGKRERVGTYLANARRYNRALPRGDRTSDTVLVTEDVRVVLEVFGEAWSAKKRRDFVQAAGDEKHAAALVEAARGHAGRLKIRPREVVRFWAERYLADGDKFVADPEHPLRLLPGRLTTYGAPKRPTVEFGPSKPKEPLPEYTPPPSDMMARLTKGAA